MDTLGMVNDEYPLRYTPTLVRRAMLGFWWRTVGLRYVLALGTCAGCVGYLVWQGDRSWRIGLLGTIFVLGIVAPAALLGMQYRQAFAKLRGMKTPEATIAVGATGLTVASDLARSEIPWSTITGLWRFADFWLLVFSQSQYMTIPLEFVPLETRHFILANIEKAGGKVVG